MSRYIDADKFLKYADEPSIYDTTDLKDMINEQPTVEVRPIVYGRGKGCEYCENENGFYEQDNNELVSIVGNTMIIKRYDEPDEMLTINYCPMCGRKLEANE